MHVPPAHFRVPNARAHARPRPASLQVLVTDREWSQRQQFLSLVRAKVAALPQRTPFYPGAQDKYDK